MLAVLVLLFGLTTGSRIDAEGTLKATEYELKAAFVLNFARFAEWPDAHKARPETIVVGVLGDDPFGTVLEDTLRGKLVAGRPLVVRRFRHVKDSRGCELLFVASSEKTRVPQVLRDIAQPGVLTIGETTRFAKLGGVIELAVEASRIRVIINTDAAARSGIRISAKLLAMASLVRDEREGNR